MNHQSLDELLDRADPHLDASVDDAAHWDGFSQADIATHLALPAGTVRSRYTRARARLRTLLSASAAAGSARPT